MNQSPEELFKRVDEVLHYLWDPIGISHIPEARDEYTSYVPKIVDALLRNTPPEELAEILSGIDTNRMGLEKAIEHDLAVAKVLISWKHHLSKI